MEAITLAQLIDRNQQGSSSATPRARYDLVNQSKSLSRKLTSRDVASFGQGSLTEKRQNAHRQGNGHLGDARASVARMALS